MWYNGSIILNKLMYKTFFSFYQYTIKFSNKIQRFSLKAKNTLTTLGRVVFLVFQKIPLLNLLFKYKLKIRLKEQYVTLGAIVFLTLILSLLLSASTGLKSNILPLTEQANVLRAANELISESGPRETLNCEQTLSDASLTCQNYYDNLVKAQKPEDFLNIYFIEDGEFVFGSQNITEGIIQGTTERSQLMSYIVKEGDTLDKIAKQFGISIDTIKVANRLSKNVLQVGKELIILPVSGVYYTVQKGDTLGKIATKYKVSVSSIIEYNGINEKYIKVGDKLVLPGAKDTPVSTAVTGQTVTQTNTGSSSGYFIYPTTGWNWGVLHNNNAVDIANACGTPIYAAADGIVIETVMSGWNGGYGSSIKIQHPSGAMTLYAHLSSVNIEKGASVKQGSFIGKMGNTGQSTGCHLHFEVRGATNPFVK